MKSAFPNHKGPPRRRAPILVVRSLSAAATQGRLTYGPFVMPCTLGRSGRRILKREGDGASPVGSWALRFVLYRPDRMRRPSTGLLLRALRPDDGWCETVGDRNYNRNVRHPYPNLTDRMWRADGLYDIVVVLGHNDTPRIQGRGSAVFLHISRDTGGPTAGCVGLKRAHLLRLLALISRRARIII